ncbi:DNA-processing protein DprA [Agrococcus terreus]|uniref:Smf/DprA SLOG domain-containing protein n=1 Tax=Agrococcus terreus TaxID=574649 RepID=A0ABQ2KHT4_9MICO|nr:DNA-processing protein DprA [Agrococcus terreus]GGN82332.1 hypothetical protein GCM10010968_12010 [Agrococcus terreus]
MTAFRVPADRLRAAVAPVLPEGATDDDAALAARFAAGAWTVLPEPGDAAAGGMRAALGDEGALALLVDGASPAAWLAALDDPELGALLPAALQRWTPRLSAERMLSAFAQAAAFGQRLVMPGDAHWPAQLDDLGPHAPAALWVRGDPAALARAGRSAALVGSRASSGYGELVAAQLAGGLVDRGLAVVSGGAYGIDGTAHRAALASGGTTIAVLAGGLDRLYPAGNEALLQRVVETACAVAEAPCGTPPTRWRFLARKRACMRQSGRGVIVTWVPRWAARARAVSFTKRSMNETHPFASASLTDGSLIPSSRTASNASTSGSVSCPWAMWCLIFSHSFRRVLTMLRDQCALGLPRPAEIE